MTQHVGYPVAVALLCGAIAACGEEPEPAQDPATTADQEVAADEHDDRPTEHDDRPAEHDDRPADHADQDAHSHPPPPEDKPSGPAESGADDPRQTALERRAQRTVRAYVAALDRRDGAAACELLVPEALTEIELPRPRGSCADSLDASIGYRDPRGLPVWEGAEISDIRSVELDRDSARVVATTQTRFADRDEISIEDDVIYLTRAGAGWLIAQPSSTLYRAVGIADVPPQVLSPPTG